MELTICSSGFDTIREEEFLYVDKTGIIFRMEPPDVLHRAPAPFREGTSPLNS